MANLSSENASDIQHDVGWYWFRVFFIAITAFLDIICNIISLIVLPKMKSLPSNNRFLVMISSVLDLTTGFAASVSIAPAILGSWPYGQQICLIYVTSATSSSCTAVILVIGALDRYIAIKKPLHYHLIVTKTRLSISCFLCIFIWFVPLLFWFLTIPLAYDYNLCICSVSTDVPLAVSIIFAIFHGMNLMIVVFVYVQLFRVARAITRANRIRSIDNNIARNNTKAIRMFFVYSGTYVCAMVPICIGSFSVNSSSIELSHQYEFLSFWFLYSYPWWNVVGFALVNSNFRQLVFKTVCHPLWCYRYHGANQ